MQGSHRALALGSEHRAAVRPPCWRLFWWFGQKLPNQWPAGAHSAELCQGPSCSSLQKATLLLRVERPSTTFNDLQRPLFICVGVASCLLDSPETESWEMRQSFLQRHLATVKEVDCWCISVQCWSQPWEMLYFINKKSSAAEQTVEHPRSLTDRLKSWSKVYSIFPSGSLQRLQ